MSKAIDKQGGNGHLSTPIAEALKKARTSRNVSLTEADKLFCGGTTNYSWFEGRPAGQRIPSADTFRAICKEWPELKPFADEVEEAEREVVGKSNRHNSYRAGSGNTVGFQTGVPDVTAPATPEAKAWQGWGTALKPAHEPILCARKRLNVVPGLDKIAAESTLLVEALLWWMSPAKFVESCSRLNLSDFGEGERLAFVRWLAVVLHGLRFEDSCDSMDTFNSPEAGSTFLSIARSWSDILDALSNGGSTFTTETETRLTTALKTLNSLLSATIPESIIKAAYPQNGLWSNAKTVAENSTDLNLGWKHIPKPSVAESVFSPIASGVANTLASIAEALSLPHPATNGASVRRDAPTDSTRGDEEAGYPLSAKTAESTLRSLPSTSGQQSTISADEPATSKGNGKGSAPKHEPIVMARKPLSEPTVARNVLKHSTGALNIEASRVGLDGEKQPNGSGKGFDAVKGFGQGSTQLGNRITEGGDKQTPAQGRWPANLILSHVPGPNGCERVGVKRVKPGNGSGKVGNPSKQSTVSCYGEYGPRPEVKGFTKLGPDGTEEVEDYRCVENCPVRLLDEQSGVSKGGRAGYTSAPDMHGGWAVASGGQKSHRGQGETRQCYSYGDKGGASRYFATFEPDVGAGFRYVAKASRRERNAGLPEGVTNDHPTVKSLGIMKYLVRMVTPPGGTVLDPFAGSGSTGCAAVLEGFNFIGIEREPEYVEIAKRRIAHYQEETSSAGKLFA